MAGLTPYPDEGYSPLRLSDGSAPDPEEEKRNIRSAFDEMALVDEASNLAANDFNVDISDDTSPDAAPTEGYKAPETIQDWENALYHASSQLEIYRKSLDQYVNDTRSIIPVDRASAAQVKARAKQIAIARRDYAKMQESITQQRQHIQEAKDAAFSQNLQAELGESYGSQIKAMAGKGLGAIGWVIAHSPLAGMVETLGGVASYGAQRLGQMLDNKFADSGVNEGTALEQLRDSPISPSTWVAATGITPDSDVRKRGREFFKKAGQALGSFEKEVILTTPVWREFHEWNPVALTIRRPLQSAIEGAQVLGNPQTDISKFEFQQATQTQKDQARDMFYEMALMTAADPLNVVDFGGGALTRLGKLRKLAAINEGALETAARIKAIERVPGMAEKLGGLDKAVDATRGALATDLLKAGMTSDEASNAAKLYDQLFKDGYAEMRAMAAADPRAWATNTDELLAKLKGGDGLKAQRDALKQVGDFEVGPTKVFGKQVSDGSKVDPILGRTFREQAMLGQRMKVWKAMYERFGDKPWFKAMGKPWAMLTGHSLLHDIGDNPELLDAYFAQRMFKADAGAEFLRFQQDVMEREAGVLNKFNETQRAQILTDLPAAVEHDVVRQGLRDPLLVDAPLRSATADLADLYDESAETLRTIQNRFNLDVADFAGPHNYFGREFSEEMQQWLATNPKARGLLFADSTRTSKGFLSTAEIPEEKARKLRDLDFEASEAQLREKFKAYGLPDNVPIWSKDSFGVLKDRAQRAMHKAELRNLYDSFIEAQAGKLDDATRTAMGAEVQQLLREHEAAKQAAFEQAAEAARKGDPANWSPKAKAEWILGRLKDPRNLVHALAPAEGEISALEVLLKNKVDVPESWDELARLAATNITPDAEREFGRLATGMYWKQLDKPGKFFAFYDALKGFYQKQVLARLGSVAGDVRGTTINGVMAGLAPADLERATRRVGSFTDWQAGKLASANARRLRSEGVLMTRALDTEQDASRLGEAIAGLLPDSKRAQKLGELASKVEKKGFVGATLDTLGLKGAGKAAEKYRNAILDYRNYVEDLNRVATYEKAISSGMSHRAAVEEVYKYWGKFDELSKLEAKGLNRIMFFWTWRARSIPVAVRHIFEHPVRSKWLLSMAAGNVDDKDKTPAWLRRMGGYVLGQGEDGGVKAINVGGSTYFDPLKSMLQGDFANMMLHGQPVAAVDGALNDFVRTLPPMLQAPVEYATKYDYFTSKPWWRDANQTESNAKAPAFLWWFYTDKDVSPVHTAVTDLLDLKPIVGKDGKALGLTMNPRWAWFFGSLPGAEVHATDASAFFRAPKDAGQVPRLAPVKGIMRQAGFPVYDVQLDDAKDQTRDFKDALIKDAASLSGGSLKADAGGIYPSTTTWRGQEIRKFLDTKAKDFKDQGLTDSQARERAFDLMRLKYPQEWRVMGLFKRVQAWEQYLIRIEDGGAEISKQQQEESLLLARRMDARRDRNKKLEEKAALK